MLANVAELAKLRKIKQLVLFCSLPIRWITSSETPSSHGEKGKYHQYVLPKWHERCYQWCQIPEMKPFRWFLKLFDRFRAPVPSGLNQKL